MRRVLRPFARVFAVCALASCGSTGEHASPVVDAAAGDAFSSSADGNSVDASPSVDGSSVVIGGPGCGLASAAFCDTFDAPSSTQGRAGEIDSAFWSASRHTGTGICAISLPTCGAFSIGQATLIEPPVLDGGVSPPPCRAALPSQVFPDRDTLVCDPGPQIGSNYLLVAVGAQNYGENSYRIRQPFDFAGRTGKIVFDAEGFTIGGLWGWVSLEVTDEPIPTPSFSLGAAATPPYSNDEGAPLPKNGFEIQFVGTCNESPANDVGIADLIVYNDYVQTVTPFDGNGSDPAPTCVATRQGSLNHFEVDVSASEIAVYASAFSADGATFPATQLLYKGPFNSPLSRGYVHLTTHNHATIKYTGTTSQFQGYPLLDAWEARWDNIGFDGPIIGGWREYEVADSLVTGNFARNDGSVVPYEDIGWIVPDQSLGPNTTLHLHAVDLSNVVSATLALTSFYLDSGATADATYSLMYRLNGNAWHDRVLNAAEVAYLSGGASRGTLAQTMDVPVSDLVPGDNTLQFVAANVPQNYPPAVANVDLVLSTH